MPFLGNVVFEIAAFQIFAQFAQGQVEVEAAHQFGGLVERELAEHGLHIFQTDFFALGGEYDAFHHAAQLLEVARPVVLAQGIQGGSVEFNGGFAALGKLLNQLLYQENNVFRLVAQGRDADHDGRKIVEQSAVVVGAGNQLLHRLAAGADDAHVVAVGLAQEEEDALLDAFAVLGNVAQIEHAVTGFLQQFDGTAADLFDFAGLHPGGVAGLEVVRHQFKR